mmetsp:Transcript_10452/g.31948  ORF Transcript_10452/g.31948 Transcript_10452/m.31948 type:complete len:120 (-) Transcript_10452:263-622(-)
MQSSMRQVSESALVCSTEWWMHHFSPSLVAAALVTIFCEDSKMDALMTVLDESGIDKEVLVDTVQFVVHRVQQFDPSRKRKISESDSAAVGTDRDLKLVRTDVELLLSSSPCSTQDEEI